MQNVNFEWKYKFEIEMKIKSRNLKGIIKNQTAKDIFR